MPEELLPGLFFFERGYLNANHFAYRSESPVLIDTAYISNIDETEQLIAGIGIDFSDVSLIINTHTHCDHIGGNQRIQERSGCDIAVHRFGCHFINCRDDWSTWWRYYHQEADFFDCTVSLNDGDVIPVGPHEFQVIHTPGHAADGIVLYHPKEKILLSSDTLWETDMAVMTLRVEGSRAIFTMQESLEKIAALDVVRVYPGHGAPFTDFSTAVAKTKARIERFLEDRDRVGNDVLKKIIVYTLMMKQRIAEDDLFPYLMSTHWYPETVNLYFNGEFELKYEEILTTFLDRGIVKRVNGTLVTTVKP